MDVTADDPSADWTAPGAYRVAQGVFRIPLPLPTDGLRAVNVYAVRDGDDLVLVDSGWAIAEARTQLEAALDALEAGLGDVRRFLVTHVHRDHYTQAVTLRREFGTRVALGEGERPSLEAVMDSEARATSPHTARLRLAGADEVIERFGQVRSAPRTDEKAWEAPDDWLGDGTTASVGGRELRAIATPGHTRGHLVYTESAAGLMFAGDHVLPHITPSIGFESAPTRFPLRDYLESLRLVRGLPDMRLLPAHGPVTDSTHARIDALLEHHDRRLDTTLAAVRAGASTAYEAAGTLTWTRRERTLAELDPFNSMLAVLETMSHLDVLVLQERATVTTVDGVYHYALR
ncbi:MAG TPA: MBL fold metallo-hydrolase [Pseudonocardiaceae bacterium]|nr:MBL fold metallo-hydrolase [Pseudonocardiaceae bacterium]